MSDKNQSAAVVLLLVIIALTITIGATFYAVGVLAPNNEGEGFFVNLQYGYERWAENPAVVAIIVAMIVNIFGYLENIAFENPQQRYEFGLLLKTVLVYEGLIIVVAQCLPIKYAILVAVVIDVLRRLAARTKQS